MRKTCHCGQTMNLGFRTVIFEGRLEISRVPIYECEDCNYYFVMPQVKADLKSYLLNHDDQQSGKFSVVKFTDINELADVIYSIYRTWNPSESRSFDVVLEQKCQERINLLLDLYGYAKSLNDVDWMYNISKRLSQLSKFVTYRQFSEAN